MASRIDLDDIDRIGKLLAAVNMLLSVVDGGEQ